MANKRRLLFEITGKRGPRTPLAGGPWVDPACYLGVEIELENHTLPPPRTMNTAGWTLKTDNSLRNGIELVFSEPLMGQDITTAIDAFYNDANPVRHQSSLRAGTHIHINWITGEEDTDSLLRLIILLWAIEPAIFELAGGGRKLCPFTHPITDLGTERVKELVKEDMEIEQVINEQASPFARYMGTNFCALQRFGTVEFRYFPAVGEREELERWINLVMCLRTACVKESLEPMQLLQLLTTPEGIASFVSKWFSFFDIDKTLLDCLDMTAATNRINTLALACQAVPITNRKMVLKELSPAMKLFINKNHGDVLARREERRIAETTYQADQMRIYGDASLDIDAREAALNQLRREYLKLISSINSKVYNTCAESSE